MIAAVAGLVAGLVLTWWRVARPAAHQPAAGRSASALAAAVMALTGHLLGPGDPSAALAAAAMRRAVPVALSRGQPCDLPGLAGRGARRRPGRALVGVPARGGEQPDVR